jgi:hypothetical protein
LIFWIYKPARNSNNSFVYTFYLTTKNIFTKMKITISVVLMCLVGIVLTAPVEQIPVLQENTIRDDHGQYSYNFLTGNGIARTEQGALVPNADRTKNVLVQRGGYRYYLPNGELLEVNYIADENGYRVTGSHLPTPPTPLV